jgi:hypothetical protein
MVNVMDLKPGDRVRLAGDVVVEVISNPKDGIWIQARYLSVPDDPSQEGTEEMIFAEDMIDQM